MTCIELWSEEAFAFIDDPNAFVRLDSEPLVWTVRGLRYFGPRFLRLGIKLQDVKSREHFHDALRAWNRFEQEALAVKLLSESPARASDRLARRCLRAIILATEEEEPLIRRLELRPVQP